MEKKIFGIQKDIFLLGIVSFLTDVSSEAIFSVFSIFFTTVLGASTALLGLIEGAADFSASSLDYFSGSISDKSGQRKKITIAGYGLSTLAKGMLIFATTVPAAALFRVVERLGKSVRGPPRDAWIASIAEGKNKGFSFGVHKALDKSGAILGPLLAYLFFTIYPETLSAFTNLFILAVIPAIAATLLLFFLKDRHSKPTEHESIFKTYRNLNKNFKRYLLAAGIFSIAYFSFSFLLLKAYIAGFALTDVILLYTLFNVAFVIFSIPIGKIGDRIGREKIIALSYVIYLLMSIGFVFANTKELVILMFVLYGMFYAIDEGQSKAYITDLERKRKGTAIGIYNFVTGIIYLPASIIAGILWMIDPSYTFAFAGIASITALGLFMWFNKNKILS